MERSNGQCDFHMTLDEPCWGAVESRNWDDDEDPRGVWETRCVGHRRGDGQDYETEPTIDEDIEEGPPQIGGPDGLNPYSDLPFALFKEAFVVNGYVMRAGSIVVCIDNSPSWLLWEVAWNHHDRIVGY